MDIETVRCCNISGNVIPRRLSNATLWLFKFFACWGVSVPASRSWRRLVTVALRRESTEAKSLPSFLPCDRSRRRRSRVAPLWLELWLELWLDPPLGSFLTGWSATVPPVKKWPPLFWGGVRQLGCNTGLARSAESGFKKGSGGPHGFLLGSHPSLHRY